MLHKFRRAMVRPGRDLLTGRIEVDESYVGGEEEGLPGRLNLKKVLIVVAAQEDGSGIGRIRMRRIIDASAESLVAFVQASVEPVSVVHTDGWAEPRLSARSHNSQTQEEDSLGPPAASPRGNLPPQTVATGHSPGAVSQKHLNYYFR